MNGIPALVWVRISLCSLDFFSFIIFEYVIFHFYECFIFVFSTAFSCLNLSSVYLFLFITHILEFSTVTFCRPPGERLSVSELESEPEASFITTCSYSSTAISFAQCAFPRTFAVPICCLLDRGVKWNKLCALTCIIYIKLSWETKSRTNKIRLHILRVFGIRTHDDGC